MRLIDADALLEEFKDRARAARNWKENALNNGDEEITIRADATLAFLTEVKLTIENAPTVELFCSYLSDGEVRQPCVEAPCKHERPQGKWKFLDHKYYDDRSRLLWAKFKCACCGEIRSFYEIPETIGEFDTDNFCPNCGARMGGG